MPKPILISGMQPTGPLHVGNYLGALKNFVSIQNSQKYKCFFFIADLHSLTEKPEADKLTDNIRTLTREVIAGGIDPEITNIFQQSIIPAHSELMYLLTTLAPEGDLRRMTQYKDKVVVKKFESNAGLLMYPVMMAADILLYNAKHVPVGEDQVQHLEFTRRMARRFNNKYGETFIEPKEVLTESPRIMSLDDPNNKMSKSSPNGCLFLSDSDKNIKEKIKRAVTDSDNKIKYDPKNKPAISNLVKIFSEMSDLTIKEIEKEFQNKTYSDFKESLANLLIKELKHFRKQKIDDKKTTSIIENGSKKAKKIGDKKIEEVKSKMGLAL